jgi:hypothetical protein
MSIETAHFAVKRGDTTYSCLGSELHKIMEEGDLLFVNRNGSNYHYTVDEVHNDIQDTDELVVTAEDGITYRVSGDKFKELFYTLPVPYTDPIINGIPIESKILSVEDPGSITRGTPPYEHDTTDWYLHDPSNPDLEDEKIDTGGGLKKEPATTLYTKSFDSTSQDGSFLAYYKATGGNILVGIVPISGQLLVDGEAVIYDQDLKVVDRYKIPANKTMINTGANRPKILNNIFWSYSQSRMVNLATYSGGGRNSTWHWLDTDSEGKIVLNSAQQDNGTIEEGNVFYPIFGPTYTWDLTTLNYGPGNTRPQCNMEVSRGLRSGFWKKHWVGSRTTEYEIEVYFNENQCVFKKRKLDSNCRPLPDSLNGGKEGYFDSNILCTEVTPGMTSTSNRQFGVLNPGVSNISSHLICIVNDYFFVFNPQSYEVIKINASDMFKEVVDPFCAARFDDKEQKVKTNMYEIGVDGTYTVYPNYTYINGREGVFNSTGRYEESGNMFDFLPHSSSYPVGLTQAVVTSKEATVQADDDQLLLLPEYVDKEVYAVCTHSDSRDVAVSMPSNSMLIGPDVSDKYLETTKPVEIVFDENTKQLTLKPHELNTNLTGRDVIKNTVGITLTYHDEPLAILPDGVGLDTHTHAEITAMNPLTMLPYVANHGEAVALKNAQWKLSFDPTSTEILYTLIFAGMGELSVNGLRFENYGHAHLRLTRAAPLSVSLLNVDSDFIALAFQNNSGLKPLRGFEKEDLPPLDLGAGELTQPFVAGTFTNPKLKSINITMVSSDDISSATSFAEYKVDERTVYEYLGVEGYS